MQVHLITNLAELESLAGDWRHLAQGNPFASPEWLITWWRHLGADSPLEGHTRTLNVLVAKDFTGEVVAIAPWYCESTLLQGRVLRMLGSGQVCSDYLTIPCREDARDEALAAIAHWLCKQRGRGVGGWDLIELEYVDLDDPRIAILIERLDAEGAITSARQAGNCWRVNLANTWEDYVATLSKTNRKRARRLDRTYLQTGRAKLHHATTAAELVDVYRILVELHTRRWQSRGEGGIFAEPGILEFHREATQRLLATGQAKLAWLEIDGQPAAAEYCLTDGSTLFSYQSGLNPELISHEPGALTFVATLQEAISQGITSLDFLRGDETYKLDWRAEPKPMHDVRILPGNLQGHLRQSLWQATTSAKDLLRAGRDAVLHAR